MGRSVSLTTIKNPFKPLSSRDVVVVEWCKGLTLWAYAVKTGVADLIKDGLELRAGINGRAIPRDQFDTVMPNDGDSLVFSVVLGQPDSADNGQGKSWGQVVAMLAVVVVAIWLPGALPAAWGVTGGYATAMTMGIMAGGSVLISALMPVNTDSKVLGTGDFSQSQSYGWDMAQNVAREGLVIPVVYGTVLLTPQIINSYVNVDVNGYQFLNMLYAVGEGPLRLEMAEDTAGTYRPAVYLNGDLASPERTSGGRLLQAEGQDCLDPAGASADSEFPQSASNKNARNYAGNACNDSLGFVNTPGDGVWRPDAWIAWPFGSASNWWMYDFGTAGKRIVKYTYYAVAGSAFYRSPNKLPREYPYAPSTGWTFQGSADGVSWNTLDTVAGYSAGTKVVRTFANTVAYRYYRMLGQWVIDEIEMFGAAGDPATVAAYAMPAWRSGYRDQTVIDGFGRTWSGNFGSFTQTKISDAYYTATTDGNLVTALGVIVTFPSGIGYVTDAGGLSEITVSIGLEYRAVGAGSWTTWTTWSITASSSSAIQRSIELTGLSPAQYQVRLKWSPTPISGTRYLNTGWWSALQSAIDDDFTYPNTALLGLHVLATDAYNGSAPRVTAKVSRDEVNVTTSPGVIEGKDAGNPAWAAYDMLVNARYGGGVSTDDILLADFTAWASFCDSMVAGAAWGASTAKTLGNMVIPYSTQELGSPSSNGDIAAYPVSNVVDNSEATEWRSSQTGATVSGYAWVALDMFTEVLVKRVRIKQATATAMSSGITSVKIQYGDNGISWSDLGSAVTIDSGSDWQDIILNTTGLFGRRYWRILADANPATGKSWALTSIEVYSVATSGNGFIYECTSAGTTGASEPVWPTAIDETVVDGGAIWTCRLNRLRVNVVFDTAFSVASALNVIAINGRGAIVKKGCKYGVIIDKPADPVQMFTMGNIIKDSLKIDYLNLEDRANIVEITYFDEENEYERTVIEVRDTAFETDNLAERDAPAITMYGCTSRAQAIAYGRHLLNQNKYQKKTVAFEAGIDAIACQPGDVILFSHDVPQWGYSGRVVDYLAAPSAILEIDRTVTIKNGKSYVVQVRNQETDVIEERAVTTGVGTTYSLTLASAFDNDPGIDAVYSFGETTNVSKEYRVLSISRASDMTRKITAVEYSDLIYSNGVGATIPVPETASALVGVFGLTVASYASASGDRSILSASWLGAALSWTVTIEEYNSEQTTLKVAQVVEVSTSYQEFYANPGRLYRVTVRGGASEAYEEARAVTLYPSPFDIKAVRTYSAGDDVTQSVRVGWHSSHQWDYSEDQRLFDGKDGLVDTTVAANGMFFICDAVDATKLGGIDHFWVLNREVDTYPNLFTDGDGSPMVFADWAFEVYNGKKVWPIGTALSYKMWWDSTAKEWVISSTTGVRGTYYWKRAKFDNGAFEPGGDATGGIWVISYRDQREYDHPDQWRYLTARLRPAWSYQPVIVAVLPGTNQTGCTLSWENIDPDWENPTIIELDPADSYAVKSGAVAVDMLTTKSLSVGATAKWYRINYGPVATLQTATLATGTSPYSVYVALPAYPEDPRWNAIMSSANNPTNYPKYSASQMLPGATGWDDFTQSRKQPFPTAGVAIWLLNTGTDDLSVSYMGVVPPRKRLHALPGITYVAPFGTVANAAEATPAISKMEDVDSALVTDFAVWEPVKVTNTSGLVVELRAGEDE